MSKDIEPKSGKQLPLEAEIFAETLREITSRMSDGPADPGMPNEIHEAQTVRHHFIRRAFGHRNHPQQDQSKEEPIH